MFIRLIDVEFLCFIFISGLIWVMWYVLIVIVGLYVEGILVLFLVFGIYFCIVLFSYIIVYL